MQEAFSHSLEVQKEQYYEVMLRLSPKLFSLDFVPQYEQNHILNGKYLFFRSSLLFLDFVYFFHHSDAPPNLKEMESQLSLSHRQYSLHKNYHTEQKYVYILFLSLK